MFNTRTRRFGSAFCAAALLFSLFPVGALPVRAEEPTPAAVVEQATPEQAAPKTAYEQVAALFAALPAASAITAETSDADKQTALDALNAAMAARAAR